MNIQITSSYGSKENIKIFQNKTQHIWYFINNEEKTYIKNKIFILVAKVSERKKVLAIYHKLIITLLLKKKYKYQIEQKLYVFQAARYKKPCISPRIGKKKLKPNMYIWALGSRTRIWAPLSLVLSLNRIASQIKPKNHV